MCRYYGCEANLMVSVCITLCRWTATARLSMPLNDRGISDYGPTCFKKGCIPSLVDVIMTNKKSLCFKSQNVPTGVSDCHNIISTVTHPTTGYLDSRCYPELRSYLRHTEWQVGISLTFFFHFIYFLDFEFMCDLLYYKWEICIPNMTV